MTVYKIKKIAGNTIDFTSDGNARMSLGTSCMLPEVAIAIYPGSYPTKAAYIAVQKSQMDAQLVDIDGLGQALKTCVVPVILTGVLAV